MNITDTTNGMKHKRRQRKGRGAAGGQGKTAGRGQKGLGSRSGANRLRGFIGGQSTIMTRLPKRGFNNAVFRTEYLPVNLALLQAKFEDGAEVDPEVLAGKGVTLRRGERVKILGTGELTIKLKVKAHAFSRSAREKIEKAGGSVEILPAPVGHGKPARAQDSAPDPATA